MTQPNLSKLCTVQCTLYSVHINRGWFIIMDGCIHGIGEGDELGNSTEGSCTMLG